MTFGVIYSPPLQAWIDWLEAGMAENADQADLVAALNLMFADDIRFVSPVVFTPQVGRELTTAYLMSAGQVLHENFRYVSIIEQNGRAVLEFECEVDGIQVNGVDLIDFNGEGKITQFKVMIRPLKAIDAVKARMAAMLEQLKSA